MGHALSMYVHMCYLRDVEDRECVHAEALHCKNKSSCLLIYQQPRGIGKFSMYTGKVFVFLCT